MSEEIEVQEEEVSPKAQAESTQNIEQSHQATEEKPKSGYIDYDVLPDEVRDTVKMRVDGDYRKLKGFEKKEAEYQKQLKEYEERLAELSKPQEVSPPTPDDFYNDPEGAERQLAAYNDFVSKNASWQSQQSFREQQQKQDQERQQVERQQSFIERTKSAGINEHELGYAASVVAPQVGNDTATYLMDHDYGPQILMQLAKNPIELQELASLNPYQVGVKLDKMAKAFKPTKVTKAPPPDDPIQGAGVDAKEEYGGLLKGAKFL